MGHTFKGPLKLNRAKRSFWHKASCLSKELSFQKVFSDRLTVNLAGITLELIHAPGETNDQIIVWYPDQVDHLVIIIIIIIEEKWPPSSGISIRWATLSSASIHPLIINILGKKKRPYHWHPEFLGHQSCIVSWTWFPSRESFFLRTTSTRPSQICQYFFYTIVINALFWTKNCSLTRNL